MELDRPSTASPRLSARLAGLVGRGMRLGIEGVAHALEALGRPDCAQPILLVGGSNGKGTTALRAAEALAACGTKVGLLTSPHLVDPRERTLLRDGAGWRMPSEEEALKDLEEVLAVSPEATYFEALILSGFVRLRKEGVEAAVVEVGLGGRLDATNATDPSVSCVTSVDLEHTRILGTTREAIGAEKAAIARAGRPFWTTEDALPFVAETARRIGAIVRVAAREELAVRAAGDLATAAGLPFDAARASAAAGAARLPGRFERFEADGVRWILDGAHNPAAARFLRACLDERLGGEPVPGEPVPGEPVVALFGFLADKDAAGFVRELAPRVERAFLTRVPGAGDRAALPSLDDSIPVACLPSADEALKVAREAARETGRPLLVTGSIYLVGWVLARLGRHAIPAPRAEAAVA